MKYAADVWAAWRGAHSTPITKDDKLYAEIYCTIQEGPKVMVGRQVRVQFELDQAKHTVKQLTEAIKKMEEMA